MGKNREKKHRKTKHEDYKAEMLEITVHIGNEKKVYRWWDDMNDIRERIRRGETLCKYNGAKDYTIINTKACSIIDLRVAEKEEKKDESI